MLSGQNWLIIVGMGFVTAALCGLAIAQQSPAPQKIWQGFGVNIHFTEPGPGEIDLLKASGVDYVRTDFNWELTEKAVGKYDFATYDRLVGQLKIARIRPLFVLDYGNKLYENGAPRTAKAQEAYARWAEAVVSHFRGEEIVWEIWNEPNIDNFWKPKSDAASYASLALKSAKAMRAADPNCRIIAPGISGMDDAFLKKVLSAELLGLIDGVSVHPYRASGPETVVKDYERVKEIIRARAPIGREDLPVVCSEWGYSTAPSTGINDERQAMYLSKLWLLSAAAGSPVTIYYGWKDDGSDPKNINHRFGIVKSNLAPKPAFDAARLTLKAFKGCTIFKRMEKKDPLDWVIVGVGEGKMVRAMWYQKVGALPKFEAYDLSDRSNRSLYNSIRAESTTTTVPPTTNPPIKQPPVTQPPVKQPPVKQPPIKQPPIKQPEPLVRTMMGIAFAPPIDDEGWCAVIQKPTSMPNAKIEFRYDRKDTGAVVTCFTNVKTSRLVEPLANNDLDSKIVAIMGGKKVVDSQIKRVELNPIMWSLRSGNGKQSLSKATMGASVDYSLSSDSQSCSIDPNSSISIPDGAKKFVIWIKPDNSLNNLYAKFKDEEGTVFQVFLGVLNSETDRNGWVAIVIPFVDLPAGTTSSGRKAGNSPKGKLEWESLFYIESLSKNNPKSGTIEFGPAAYEF